MYYHFHLKDNLKNNYVNIFFVVSATARDKIIIKAVSNIIEIGSITNKGEYNWHIGCHSFFHREIQDLIPFHVFLILFQFLSKFLS